MQAGYNVRTVMYFGNYHFFFFFCCLQNANPWYPTVQSVSTLYVVENVRVTFMLSSTNPEWFAFGVAQTTSLLTTQATLENTARNRL